MSNSTVSNNHIRIAVNALFIGFMLSASFAIYYFRSSLQHFTDATYVGVFIGCLIANATVLLPSPSLLFVVAASTFLNPALVALSGALGSTLGELVGFMTGRTGASIVPDTYPRIFAFFNQYGLLAVFVFALVPLPLFDIVGLIAGYAKVPWYKFIICCFLGKFLKMIIYSYGGMILSSFI